MSRTALEKMIARRPGWLASIEGLITLLDGPISVWDSNDHPLIEPASPHAGEVGKAYPIWANGQQWGWTMGGEGAAEIAGIISAVANSQMERKALGTEALLRYRELKLLYNLSKKLATAEHLEHMARITLENVIRLIPSDLGAVLWTETESGKWTLLAGFGEEEHLENMLNPTGGIIPAFDRRGRAEIFNHVDESTNPLVAVHGVRSWMYVPMKIETKVKTRILGEITLARRSEEIFTAGDLELLDTVAAQTAPVLEHTHLHEHAVNQARLREQELHRQIRTLEVELQNASRRASEKASQITSSDYFKRLRDQGPGLRGIIDDEGQ